MIGAMLLALLAPTPAPPAWTLMGDVPSAYETGVLEGRGPGGLPATYLRAVADPGAGHFGGLGQPGPVEQFRGRRLRLRIWERSQDVANWAGVWLRVDGPHDEVQAFDNEKDRPTRGTRPWSQHEIVVDVPANAERLVFGVFLRGSGMVAVSDARLEPVSKDVALTGTWGEPNDAPAGLELEPATP